MQDLILGAPTSHLKKIYAESGVADKVTEEEFFQFIQTQREADPDFLEPMGMGENNAQLRMLFSGGTYEMARLAAQMSRSYLFTDLEMRWAVIKHDRRKQSAENTAFVRSCSMAWKRRKDR
jgi:hypothetical protein